MDVGADEVFTFNKGFSHKLYRIKINQVQLKETVSINISLYVKLASIMLIDQLISKIAISKLVKQYTP